MLRLHGRSASTAVGPERVCVADDRGDRAGIRWALELGLIILLFDLQECMLHCAGCIVYVLDKAVFMNR